MNDAGRVAQVRLEHVSKSFAGQLAVDDVSLAVARGEIFCLLGASGCGKTTLLRLVAGFEVTDHGRIFVADFIGTANLFTGRIVELGADRTVLDCATLGTTLQIQQPWAGARGDTVALMLRPEQIDLRASTSTASTANAVYGTLRGIAYVGDAWLYDVELASGAAVKVTAANSAPSARAGLEPGSPVRLSWSATSGVLLDA
ncbi:MAG: TOBE domain-containing protein [Gammaproteobacteria bacterium]